MKKLILIFLFIFFVLPVNAKIITGEVEYNAESACQEVFSKEPETISFDFIRGHLTDKNAVDNISGLMQGIKHFNGRKGAMFSDGSYGIVYDDEPEYTWFYKGGKLISFTMRSSLDFPAKVTRYKPDGSVTNIGLKVSEEESFIYSPDGKLIAHWVGLNCYDSSNRLVMTRKYN